ncbi:MAG TPA: hypothetical protein VFK88_06145 [Gallionella sp.]|nr:hypothetical protein [Gallionella sp.]
MKIRALFLFLVAISLYGCATPYKPYGTLGGYQDKQLAVDRFSIRYVVNGNATKLSLQTYWLYRAAELTVANGFDGFEITSPVVIHAHASNYTLLTSQDAGLPYVLDLYTKYVSMGGGFAPDMAGEIVLLKVPVKDNPPTIFDAHRLLSDLQPLVQGVKCQGDNVCPHDPRYLVSQNSATK